MSWRSTRCNQIPQAHVYQITNQLNTRSDSLQQLRGATQADDTLAIFKMHH